MKRFLPCLLLASALFAADDKDSGRLKLFDGETTFGWKIDGEALVEKGRLILGGTKATTAEVTARFGPSSVFVLLQREGDARAWLGDSEVKLRDKSLTKLNAALVAGVVPLRIEVPASAKMVISEATLRPEHMKPLFDGKSLEGWTVFKGDAKRQKSKFSVADGILTVKDGPGDLATTTHHDDFVLQLECRSNGKHLNSGIFFRAIPGEYQNGYEAQIQHDFTLEAPKNYLVDVFDPATHTAKGKREVLSSARDFGTGAIYRRIPARKAVARDGEWFTLTVVARGRHIATWVNGIQQVDWTDERPAHDNPRNGYREKAGAISIQGHDPTTDLSFRNLRIAAIARKK